MMNHWQQLLPVDQYRVTTKGILDDYSRKIITMLYQPLIGPLSVSLYMTLWSELESNKRWSQEANHYSLMNMLDAPLNDIYQARVKLEGIGLMKAFKRVNEEETTFVYELMAPLSPEQFFTDGMLNIYLYKKIGKVQFAKLKKFFCDEEFDRSSYEEITKSFADVFVSSHLTSLYVAEDSKGDLEPAAGQAFHSEVQPKELEGFSHSFDFGLFFAGLKSSLVPEKAFSKNIKETIAKLSFIYGINPLVMQSLVIKAMNEQNEIDEEELRKAARDWFQIEYSDEYPSLSEQIQPAKYRQAAAEPASEEDVFIQHLETISPRELLRQYGNGAEPTSQVMRTVEEVMLDQKLLPGVMNVLIDFVMNINDMKFTNSYVKAIAGQWARKNVKTVKDAMELARAEYKKSQNKQAKGSNSTYNSKKAVRTEIVPDWLKEGKVEASTDQTKAEEPDFARQREEMQAKLKKKYNAKG
ncbi:replication initiation and membrane attachment family protein [Bacillus sp. 1P06AnD]|uniref:replication initiation and membrane attachment family protein n=1 Tax=Bacillus sp. 1P06AnD TaxID=3132208 RepID=UPI0039A34352